MLGRVSCEHGLFSKKVCNPRCRCGLTSRAGNSDNATGPLVIENRRFVDDCRFPLSKFGESKGFLNEWMFSGHTRIEDDNISRRDVGEPVSAKRKFNFSF